MSDIQIGPNRCGDCGGEYGEHRDDCPGGGVVLNKRDKAHAAEVELPLCPRHDKPILPRCGCPRCYDDSREAERLREVADEPTKPSRRNRVGMPASLWLQEFGSQVWAAFGSPPYLVGSALVGEREPHDVDVRLILSDEDYEAWGLGDPRNPHLNAKWVSLVLAYSALGRRMTGLPIDFQIQQQTKANEDKGPRSAIGLVALRMAE